MPPPNMPSVLIGMSALLTCLYLSQVYAAMQYRISPRSEPVNPKKERPPKTWQHQHRSGLASNLLSPTPKSALNLAPAPLFLVLFLACSSEPSRSTLASAQA